MSCLMLAATVYGAIGLLLGFGALGYRRARDPGDSPGIMESAAQLVVTALFWPALAAMAFGADIGEELRDYDRGNRP